MLFVMNLWLASIAGRFINDMVPVIAILSGWVIWIFIDWIDYKQMIRNIRSAGGGFHGIRRGVKFLHLFGILFLAFIIILPNTFVAFDAAVPNAANPDDRSSLLKWESFGREHQGAYGLAIIKERYWADAFEWLKKQDTEIENPADRPGFISWWDYGFYEAALGEHPTVADNFQDGIPVAANFHTATSEKEAVSVLIVRLLEGNIRLDDDRRPSEKVIEILTKYLGENNSLKIAGWLQNHKTADSYGNPIGEEYDPETSKDYTVGQQYAENAVYHDTIKIINETLDDEGVTWLYHDLQEATGWSIRYYGVEGYDRQIFSIFAFLSDKSLLLINGIADDFVELIYEGYTVDSQGNKVQDKTWKADELLGLSRTERSKIVVTNTNRKYKDLYFETMFYRTYIGPAQGEPGAKEEFTYQIPCANMKHFYAEYFSDLSKYPYYDTGKAAVVIAKYYEGAHVNGTVTFKGVPIDCEVVVIKNNTYYENFSIPIDHDLDIINTLDENETGNFSLIAGADVVVQIRKNVDEGQLFIYRNITFDGPYGSNFAPITDDDAMRRNGSNFERYLDVAIESANVSGYVFNDTDYNGLYNATIDEPIPDLEVNLYRITRFYKDENNENKIELDFGNASYLTTDENGYYNTSGLLPGIYRVTATRGQFFNYLVDLALNEGNNTQNIINAKPARIEGLIYFDEDGDEKIDSNELLPNTDVELILYIEQTDQQIPVSSTKTDANGSYSFDSLIPGIINNLEVNNYLIRASKPPEYLSEVTLYPAENQTTYQNISIGLAPIRLSGNTYYNGESIGNIVINFDKNESVEDNTAVADTFVSNSNGFYSDDIIPGSYNVTVDQYEGDTLVYIFEGYLVLVKEDEVASYNITLIKKSVTVSGTTSYEGLNIDNVTIDFISDITVENNTAISESSMSDENGQYLIELTPGYYNVSAISGIISEDDKNYTYMWEGNLEILETDISIGITFDIDDFEKILEEE